MREYWPKVAICGSVVLLVCAGCNLKDPLAEEPGRDLGPSTDAGERVDMRDVDVADMGDAGSGGDMDVPDVSVTIAVPAGDTLYASAVATLEVEVSGATPDVVELVRRGEDNTVVLGDLSSSGGAYEWNVSQLEEGSYTVYARAILGGREFSSRDVTVVVDRSAPVVEETTPVDGDDGVSAGAAIRVTFDEPMDEVSATDPANISMRLGSDEPIDVMLSLSDDGRTLTIEPVEPPGAGARVRVVLSEAIQNAAGIALDGEFAWGWSYPLFLANEVPTRSMSRVSVGAPSIALGARGEPVVAWTECTDSSSKCTDGGDVFVSRYESGMWSELGGRVDGSSQSPAGLPSLVLDSQGRPVVAFVEDGAVFVKRWEGVSWKLLGSRLAVNDALSPSEVDLEMGAGDRPMVAWLEGRPSDDQSSIYVREFNGQSWNPIGNDSASKNSNVFNLDLEIAADGRPIVLYSIFGRYEHFAVKFNGSGWEELGRDPLKVEIENGRDVVEVGTSLEIDPITKAPVVLHESCADPNQGCDEFALTISVPSAAEGWSEWDAVGPITARREGELLDPVSSSFVEGGVYSVVWHVEEPLLRVRLYEGAAALLEDATFEAKGGVFGAPKVAVSSSKDLYMAVQFDVVSVGQSGGDGIYERIEVYRYNE